MTTLTIFDFETTGLVEDFKIPSDDPSHPHIVQLAAKQVNAETRQVIQSMNFIVFPAGWVIPSETVDIHGITNHEAAEYGLREELALECLFRMLESSDKVVAHNANFDKKIARIGFMRYFGRDRADFIKSKFPKENTICTMNKSIKPVGAGRWPKLVAAYKHFTGEDMPNAHNAMGDVEGCETVLWALVDAGLVDI